MYRKFGLKKKWISPGKVASLDRNHMIKILVGFLKIGIIIFSFNKTLTGDILEWTKQNLHDIILSQSNGKFIIFNQTIKRSLTCMLILISHLKCKFLFLFRELYLPNCSLLCGICSVSFILIRTQTPAQNATRKSSSL